MARVRKQISVRGQVQGVGFRPFVCRLANELSLAGLVRNDSHGAWIEVEGEEPALATFCRRLQAESPPLARIHEIRLESVEPRADERFVIVETRCDTEPDVGITPDVVVCADCLAELFDPNDRRYRYPFINCTNCGPRYSIVESVPYDRPNTTMRTFRMCARCQEEYDDPRDRRFHAQPNACPACGPRLSLVDAAGRPLDGDPIARTAAMLRDGRIVAIKGIGGFHLACRADVDAPVACLRRRKERDTKPFAVMVPDLDAARRLAHLSDAAVEALLSLERPIVLVPPRDGAARPFSRHVAFDTPYVGLLLPYAPLHHLLFAEGLPPLVMTSGNPSNEPLTCDNDEALRRLGGLADAFLMHDRAIRRRVDDSVMIAACECLTPIRRARGYAPAAVLLKRSARVPVLAVGGELKSAVCFLRGRRAVLSEHLGDLKSPDTYRHFVRTVRGLGELLRCEPVCIAHDLHPMYLSTQYARQQGKPLVGVQHHHAHLAACLAENGAEGPVIGVCCDGTGYGEDGAIWGCEIMVVDVLGFRRVGHLRYFLLPGGDAAAEQTFRPARSILEQLDPALRADVLRRLPADVARECEAAGVMLSRRLNCPSTSSLGRLFDAAACLLGLCFRNDHEARAAMALEQRAQGWLRANGGWDASGCPAVAYPFALNCVGDVVELDWRPTMQALIADAAGGTDVGAVAARFHETVAQMLASAAGAEARKAGLTTVALSGGCFANAILSRRVAGLLSAGGLSVLTHRSVPPGDGGIALGQAVVAAARLERNGYVSGSARADR